MENKSNSVPYSTNEFTHNPNNSTYSTHTRYDGLRTFSKEMWISLTTGGLGVITILAVTDGILWFALKAWGIAGVAMFLFMMYIAVNIVMNMVRNGWLPYILFMVIGCFFIAVFG